MFHSARWKAYLQKIQNDEESDVIEDIDSISILFHKLHTQSSTLFVKKKDNGHQKAAEEHLRRSDELLKDCTSRMDALEATLANTPKPSEVLDWNTMTLRDLLGSSPE